MTLKEDVAQNVISDSTLILQYCYLLPGEIPDEEMLEDFKDINPRYSPEQILKLRSYLENNHENISVEKEMRDEFWIKELNDVEYNMLTKYYKRLNLDPYYKMTLRFHCTIIFREIVDIKKNIDDKKYKICLLSSYIINNNYHNVDVYDNNVNNDYKFVKNNFNEKIFDSEWLFRQLAVINIQLMTLKEDVAKNVISDSSLILQYCYLLPGEIPDEEMLEDFKDINPRYSPEQILKLRSYLENNHENISVEKEMRDEFWIKELNEVEYSMLARYYERLNLDPCDQKTLRYHFTILFREFVNIKKFIDDKKYKFCLITTPTVNNNNNIHTNDNNNYDTNHNLTITCNPDNYFVEIPPTEQVDYYVENDDDKNNDENHNITTTWNTDNNFGEFVRTNDDDFVVYCDDIV
ncbi:anaphase-promoting complex subunit 1-like isoform X2 [Daktulosphaira vitifoliae]|nr:anaphase-promoting complex subunit 1-like isoform X2 [Daktulosphaira vitifoliae]